MSKDRFEFGKNWNKFLKNLDETKIEKAVDSLKEWLNVSDLNGKTFLDIGSGSGLFSLAAKRLGATVHSFDYDPESVECTKILKHRYYPDDPDWTVERGDALDENYLSKYEKHDIVRNYLLPKQMKMHGLKPGQLEIAQEAVSLLMREYVRETGVRNLDREIGSLCRKAAKMIVEGKKKV